MSRPVATPDRVFFLNMFMSRRWFIVTSSISGFWFNNSPFQSWLESPQVPREAHQVCEWYEVKPYMAIFYHHDGMHELWPRLLQAGQYRCLNMPEYHHFCFSLFFFSCVCLHRFGKQTNSRNLPKPKELNYNKYYNVQKKNNAKLKLF